MAKFDPDAYLSGSEPEKKKPVSEFDPDAYLKEPAPVEQTSAATQFGRSAASLADTALNTVTGTLDYAAYPFALAYYGATGNRSLAEASRLAQQETTSPKDVVGRAFGVAGTPEYENAPLRAAGTAIGQGLNEYAIKPVVEATGLPEEYVGNIVNTALMGAAPAAGRVAAPVVRGAGKVVGAVDNTISAVPRVIGAVPDVVEGAYGAVTGKIAKPGVEPEVWQTRSSRVPVGKEFMTPDDLQAWRTGELTTEQARAAMRPSNELPARALQATEGNIPYKGESARAFGEQIGEVYRNPLNVLTDVGLDVLTGTPLPTMARLGYKGYKALQQARGANELANLGFSPIFPEELTALRKGQEHPSYLGPVPVQGAPLAPVAPAAPAAAAPVVQPTVQPVAPMLGYDPTVQPTRAFSERPPAPQPFYADQQGNVSASRPLAGSEAGYQERLTAAQQIQAATDEALARQRAQVDADMAAMEASRLQAEQARAAQQEALRQQIAAKGVSPVAPTEVVPAVETPAPKVNLTPDEIRAMIEAKKKKPAATEEPAPAAEGSVAPIELPPESVVNESPFEWANKPQEKKTVIDETATKSEVKQKLKDTATAFVTKENNQIKIDRAAFDEIAQQYGVELNWEDLKSGRTLPEAREYVREFVYNAIKDKIAVEKRGERYSTIVKREEAAKTPEQRAAEDATVRENIDRVNSLRNRFKSGKMGMMTEGEAPMSKEEWFNQRMIDELSGKPTLGSYIDGDKLITHTVEGVGPFEGVFRTEYSLTTREQIGPKRRVEWNKPKK